MTLLIITFGLHRRRHRRPRRAGRGGRPGVLGRRSGSGSAAATRTTRPARSCRTSTPRGCCRSSRRGRCCRGTSPGSSGAAARSSCCSGRSTGRTASGRSRPRSSWSLLGFPIGANLDTGNINLLLTLMLWGAQFTGPVVAGLLWSVATWMKWAPVVFLPVLAPRARLWGLVFLAAFGAAQPGDAAADDPPAPGAVRLRGAAAPARLPRVPVGARPVPLAQAGAVRLPPPSRGGGSKLGRRSRLPPRRGCRTRRRDRRSRDTPEPRRRD